MHVRRLWALLLLPGGLAVGHTLGYRLAAEAGSASPVTDGHGYIGDLAFLAIPVTVAVLLRAFLAGLRGELAPVRLAPLVAQQVALYLIVELCEHAGRGIHPATALGERSLLIGLLVQSLVAGTFWLLVRGLCRAGVAMAAAIAAPGGDRTPRRQWSVTPQDGTHRPARVASVSRRGPPLVPALR